MAIASKGEHVEAMTVKGVILRLTMKEAQVLLDVVEQIAGDPEKTRRGLTQNVRAALCGIDGLFSCDDVPEKYSAEDFSGNITFIEEKRKL